MESSTGKKPYDEWCGEVDERLRRIYCTSLEDAGLDEDYLLRHWQSDEAPLEFVEWYGNKYDLTPRSDIEWGLFRLSL